MREQRGSVRAHVCEGDFFDIGTPDDYVRTARVFAAREQRGNHGVRATVHSTADVRETILWDDVVVEGGAYVDRCVVTDGVVVPAGTTWKGSLLRRANGDLAPRERRVGDLAVAPLA